MHTIETRKKIYSAWINKRSILEASRSLNVHRRTIRDYYKKFSTDVYPNWHRGPAQTRLNLFHCGFDSHHVYQYLYALGMYFGDGHITKMKTLHNGNSNYRLRIYLDAKYPKIIERIDSALDVVIPKSKILQMAKGKDGCVIVYVYSNDLLDLFPQHGPGVKHNRKIELEKWQKKLIRSAPKPFIKGLIESDGCRYINKVKGHEYPSYSFSNKSDDLHQIFSWACSLVEITPRRSGEQSNICTRGNVAILDTFVGKKS